jgi:hypothetical protein
VVIGIVGKGCDTAGGDEAAAARVGEAFVTLPAEDNNVGAVELRLKTLPVGIVAEFGRHAAIGGSDLAVYRDDGVADDLHG